MITKKIDLATVVKNINTTLGTGTVSTNNALDIPTIPFISSGSPSLDRAIGIGGYPLGRVIEVFGPESGGKTSLAVLLAAQVQLQGGVVAYIDTENSLDLQHCKDLGMDVDATLFSQPGSAEEAFDLVEYYLKNNLVNLIVVDSVAALTPKAEIDGAVGDSTIGVVARMMGQAMRKFVSLASKTETTMLFINQVRDKIGVTFGNPEVTTGGKALPFYASVRLRVSKGTPIMDSTGKMQIGSILKVKVVKNKVAPPFREAEPHLMFDNGFDALREQFEPWVDMGIITRAGSWYSYNDTKLGQGAEAAIEVIRNDFTLYTELTDKFKEITSNKYIIPKRKKS